MQNAALRPIQILKPAVAERIAAGEVIERPSSVVKELIENSLDAGATEISVSLEDGGKSLIEVTDNGHGMGPEDLSLCVLRHATSKLNVLDDLERIHTLGFRGEALPSVAAVSQLSIISRRAGSDAAFELTLGDLSERNEDSARPERVTFGHFLHSMHGTRIQARGLFAQVPARLKFLKSQGAEVSQVREWMERLALTHPQTGFQLFSEGRAILTLRPEDEASRTRTLLGDKNDTPIITSTWSDEAHTPSLRLRAHWLQGLSVPNARKLVQVINGRAVRDRVVQQALLSPFRQALLPGQFPAFALYLEIDPSQLDVNVHPTKTEVRFLESGRVFRAIESLVETMIARHGAPAYASTLWRASENPSPIPSFRPANVATPSPVWNFSAPPVIPSDSETPRVVSQNPFQHARFNGIAFNTYLLFEHESELIVIDQHAADERIRYEALKKKFTSRTLSSQALLLPEAVRFAPEQRQRLLERLAWIQKLGFEAEIFGEDSLLFRAIPAEWGTDSLRTRLKNLIDRLLATEVTEKNESALAVDESLFESLASEACHSAIRAGDALEPIEARAILGRLFECTHPWNCPHGRPTVVRLARGKLEEWFQRRV